MAKGDPSGLYVSEPLDDSSLQNLRASVEREFIRLQSSYELSIARNVEFLDVEPPRRREGMIRGADGTNWNPGSGKGIYAYYSGSWHFLG